MPSLYSRACKAYPYLAHIPRRTTQHLRAGYIVAMRTLGDKHVLHISQPTVKWGNLNGSNPH